MQDLQQQLRELEVRKVEALQRLNSDPAEGLALHATLLTDVPELRQRIEDLVALWSADAESRAAMPALDVWLHDTLIGHHGGLELSKAMGHYRVGEAGPCARHLANYLGLSAGRADPSRPMALELLARLELDAGRPDRAHEHAAALDTEARHWTEAHAWQGLAPPGEEDAQALNAWRQVSSACALLADLALAEGHREAYLGHSREAQALAERAGADDAVRTLWWARTAYELTWDASGERLDRAEADVRQSAPPAVRGQADFQRRMLQARAQVWSQRGRAERAIALLQQAQATPEAADPAAGWTLHLDLADLYSGQGRHGEALREADAAVAAARQLQSAVVLRQCLDRRRAMRQASGERAAIEIALDELEAEACADEPAGDTATRWQTRTMLLLALQRHDEALATLNRLEALPPAALALAAVTPASLAGLRAAVLRDAGRVAEAVAVLQAAALAMQTAPGGAGVPEPWRDRAAQWQTLTFGAAINLAELGQAEEAVAWAERGREPLWAAALRRHGRPVRALDVPALRGELQARRSALLMPLLGHRRTVVVVLPADGGAAQVHRLDIGQAEWHARFDTMESGASQWNPRFADNLAVFSQWLGTCLEEAMRGARQLVVVPEGVLALVPWAGLQLPGGMRLAECVSTVLVPTLGFGLRDAATPARPRLLSAGAGVSGEGAATHDFSAMAREIAAHYTRGPVTELPAATREAFIEQAPAHDVLHLSFHGNVQPGRLDPLAASTLDFEGGTRLSARQLLETWPEAAGFEAVFLNACVSGGYAYDRDAGAGGFMQAFLEAGARQVVATLAYVDPGEAQALALRFHRAWQPGVDVATALQSAQRESLAAGAAPQAWATHVAVAAGFL